MSTTNKPQHLTAVPNDHAEQPTENNTSKGTFDDDELIDALVKIGGVPRDKAKQQLMLPRVREAVMGYCTKKLEKESEAVLGMFQKAMAELEGNEPTTNQATEPTTPTELPTPAAAPKATLPKQPRQTDVQKTLAMLNGGTNLEFPAYVAESAEHLIALWVVMLQVIIPARRALQTLREQQNAETAPKYEVYLLALKDWIRDVQRVMDTVDAVLPRFGVDPNNKERVPGHLLEETKYRLVGTPLEPYLTPPVNPDDAEKAEAEADAKRQAEAEARAEKIAQEAADREQREATIQAIIRKITDHFPNVPKDAIEKRARKIASQPGDSIEDKLRNAAVGMAIQTGANEKTIGLAYGAAIGLSAADLEKLVAEKHELNKVVATRLPYALQEPDYVGKMKPTKQEQQGGKKGGKKNRNKK